MFNGKMKALTFSYDDGVTQDRRLIGLFNKYGLKCTFNLNSGTLGTGGPMIREEVTIPHVKPRASEVRAIYEGHEIAAHTVTHPWLNRLTDEEVIREVEEDRLALSEIADYEVVGMAYPMGTQAMNAHVADLIRQHTGIRYARTTTSTFRFDLQDDLIVFDPTVYHHREWDKLFELGEKFVELKPSEPQLFYVWGHAYEFDIHDDWDRFEEFLKLVSGKKDIFYGTNREVLLGEGGPHA